MAKSKQENSSSTTGCSDDCCRPCCCFYTFVNNNGGHLGSLDCGNSGGGDGEACVVGVVGGIAVAAIFGGFLYSATELAYTFGVSIKQDIARTSLMGAAGDGAGYAGYLLGEYLASDESDDTKHKAIVGITTALAASTGTSLMAGFTRLFLARDHRLNTVAAPGEPVQEKSPRPFL